MAYELKPGEKLRRGIRRIAKSQVKRILCTLTETEQPKGESVHEARKSLKKARAALRLVREELGDRAYRRDARHLRKVARALSAQRDAQVQLKTVEELVAHCKGKQLCGALMKLHRILQSRFREALQQPDGDPKDLEGELRAARRHARRWPMGNLKWTDLVCGIGQTYKRGSRAYQKAERSRDPVDLHEWRKRAKGLWYQLRILRPVEQEALKGLTDQMKKLGQLLGDDHDLFMIAEAAKTPELNCRDQEAITIFVEQRRETLQKEAFQLGKRLFSEKPSEFIERMDTYGKNAKN